MGREDYLSVGFGTWMFVRGSAELGSTTLFDTLY